MEAAITVTPAQLPEVLLHVAVVRPVFLWGAPGIGKSSLVKAFAESLGLECVTMLGTQLAPEDLIGVPQIVDGRSRFAPPTSIARDEPYCLFLDELNASSAEVQKAFYSLILDRRIGEYELPHGSVVIGAGNRATDNALARPMASALLNRLVHVHLRASATDWIGWAGRAGIHPWVLDYLTNRPDHLWKTPPKTDASSFRSFVKTVRNAYGLEAILKGDAGWPSRPEDRDLLYFLAETFRARLVKELAKDKEAGSAASKQLAYRGKALLVELAETSLEIAQIVIASDDDGKPVLPSWFLVEVARDLPRLVAGRS